MNGPHPSSIRPPSHLSDMPQNLLFGSATDGDDEVFISHYVDALPYVVSVLNVPSSSINAMDSHKPDAPGSGIQEVKGAGRNKFIVKSAQWSHSQSAYVNSTSETPPGVIRFLLLEGIAHSIRRG